MKQFTCLIIILQFVPFCYPVDNKIPDQPEIKMILAYFVEPGYNTISPLAKEIINDLEAALIASDVYKSFAITPQHGIPELENELIYEPANLPQSQKSNFQYLFYGKIIKESENIKGISTYKIEVTVYDIDKKENIRNFYDDFASNNEEDKKNYLALAVKWLGLRIVEYLSIINNIEFESDEKIQNIKGHYLHTCVGVWFILNEWSKLLQGTIDIAIAYMYIPNNPLHNYKPTGGYYRFFGEISCAHAHQTEYIQKIIFHSIGINVGMQYCFQTKSRILYSGFGPVLQIDMANQISEYEDIPVQWQSSLGGELNFGVEFWYSNNFGIGFQDRFTYILYEHSFLKNQVDIYVTFWPCSKSGNNKEKK